MIQFSSTEIVTSKKCTAIFEVSASNFLLSILEFRN